MLGLLTAPPCPGLAGGVHDEGPGLNGWDSEALKLDFLDTIGVLGFLLSFFLN